MVGTRQLLGMNWINWIFGVESTCIRVPRSQPIWKLLGVVSRLALIEELEAAPFTEGDAGVRAQLHSESRITSAHRWRFGGESCLGPVRKCQAGPLSSSKTLSTERPYRFRVARESDESDFQDRKQRSKRSDGGDPTHDPRSRSFAPLKPRRTTVHTIEKLKANVSKQRGEPGDWAN